MIDPHHFDCGRLIIDPIHDSVGAASSRHIFSQFADERLSDSMRVFEQWFEHELDDGWRDLLRESGEAAFG